MRRWTSSLAVMVIAAASRFATAAEGEEADARFGEDYPTELTRRPLTLPAGLFGIAFPFQSDLSSAGVNKPVSFSIPVSVGYGLTPTIQLDAFTTTGFCLNGDPTGCPQLMDDGGVRVEASFIRARGAEVSALAGIDILRIADPSAVAAQVGLAGKWSLGFLGLESRALLNIGLNNRDSSTNVTEILIPPNVGLFTRNLGNKEVLAAAVQPQVQLGRLVAVYGIAGLAGRLDSFSDSLVVPMGAGFMYVPNPLIDLGVEFAFDSLIGKNGSPQARTGRAFANLRF